MQSDRIAVESIRAVSETKGPERGATLCENARSGCSHATIESKSQLRRIFDACAACRLNQSCAQMARGMVKPRTEFFAISDAFLKHALDRRWYAYEQTIVLLLHAFTGLHRSRHVSKVPLGTITDEEAGRSRLDGAMQEVERTERVLKLYWRERFGDRKDWKEVFRVLDAQSEKIRSAAMVILEQILT